jgi:DNA-binding NarL/FixJ family response regulator
MRDQGSQNRPEVHSSDVSGKPIFLGARQQQIVDLLLQGCSNAEIAEDLTMNRRTVKAHFNRLFLRFGITDGIKRVKLATLLYRNQLILDDNAANKRVPNERERKIVA